MASPSINLVSTDLVHEEAHRLAATHGLQESDFNLSKFALSTVRAINETFPALATGDVIIVHGKMADPERHIMHIPAHARDSVVSHLARIYHASGEAPNLEVFIVPNQGLGEKVPYAKGTHFSICTAADFYVLFTRQERRQDARRRTEALELLEALGA